jgi:hypothetical protein
VQLSEGFELTEHSRNELGNGRVDMWLAPTNRQDAMSDLGLCCAKTRQRGGPLEWTFPRFAILVVGILDRGQF